MCGYVAASDGDNFQALTPRVARRAVLLIMFWRTRVVALCGFVGCGGACQLDCPLAATLR